MKKTLRAIRSNQRIFSPENPLVLLALFALAYLGNVFNLSLFFGIDFLFGSIATWLTLFLYGPFWAIAVGTFASIHTQVLWNHPYAIIIFVSEILFVSYYKKHDRQRMVFHDVLYWLCLGIPLVLLFYGFILHLDWQGTTVIALKQTVNGIFNAEVASLIVTYMPLRKLLAFKTEEEKPSLKQIVFTILIAFIIFPSLVLTVFNGREKFVAIERNVDQTLIQTGDSIARKLQLWEGQYLYTFHSLTTLIGEEGIDSPVTGPAIRNIQALYPEISVPPKQCT